MYRILTLCTCRAIIMLTRIDIRGVIYIYNYISMVNSNMIHTPSNKFLCKIIIIACIW